MFTIEDLKQGRCAVINDGTLEELREVLRSALPDSILDVAGGCRYYFLDKKLKNEDGVYIWDLDKNTNLPTQSVKDFLNKELKRGDLVWVSDNDPDERDLQLIFLTKVDGARYPFICVKESDEICFNDGEVFDTIHYRYATKVEEPKEVCMTVEEIEKALNIKNLKIVK